MKITRRDFLRYCVSSAVSLGLNVSELIDLKEVFANPQGPTVLWLQGSGCTGCSVSFLNRIASSDPKTAGDVLINSINLAHHPNLMALAGQSAVDRAKEAYARGGFLLAIEGGIPTGLGGSPCWAWTDNGADVTFQKVVIDYANRAAAILCIGTCAAWGGISAAPPNPTGVKGVKAVTGKNTINIAGCPPHPDWMVWAVVQLVLGKTISLDGNGRPTQLFDKKVHEICPRRGREEAHQLGLDGFCLKEIGCRGPETKAGCPTSKWNNGVNWCIGANAPCLGCTEPTFPGIKSFYRNI